MVCENKEKKFVNPVLTYTEVERVALLFFFHFHHHYKYLKEVYLLKNKVRKPVRVLK
jgi:hypothetical protein